MARPSLTLSFLIRNGNPSVSSRIDLTFSFFIEAMASNHYWLFSILVTNPARCIQ